MKVFYSDHLLVPLPSGHRFPMPKYGRLHARLSQSKIPGIELCPSSPADVEQILLIHTAEYHRKVARGELTEREIRRIGLPWSPALYQRTMHAVGGTIEACRAAIREGFSVNLAGGTHHAYPDHGEGYCVFNDVAVASRVIQQEGLASRVLILDCDVHQGNGSAAIFSKDPTVFTFSIHGQKNFPYHKFPSDMDVALPDGSGDVEFLDAVHRNIPDALLRADPKLVVYIAGADPYINDQLGRLAVTKEGLARRDRWVLEHCKGRRLPVAIVLGGGYARNIEDVVDIHMETIRCAAEILHEPG